MIILIMAITLTMAYQVADEGRTPESLDTKVKETRPQKANPYQDFAGDER